MTNLVATNDIQVMVVFPNGFHDSRLAGTSQTIQLSQILLDGDNILQISDQTLKERLTRWFDTTADLSGLIVERPSTGNIVVRAKTVFGSVLIVSRHQPLVDWLALRGITGEVIQHVDDPTVLDGRDVFGILPLHLASRCKSITEVSMPNMTLEQRQKNAKGDMTVEEMGAAGAVMRKFEVKEVQP